MEEELQNIIYTKYGVNNSSEFLRVLYSKTTDSQVCCLFFLEEKTFTKMIDKKDFKRFIELKHPRYTFYE